MSARVYVPRTRINMCVCMCVCVCVYVCMGHTLSAESVLIEHVTTNKSHKQ